MSIQESDEFRYAPMVFGKYWDMDLVSFDEDYDQVIHDPQEFIRGSERLEINGRVIYVKGNLIYIDDLYPEDSDDLKPLEEEW